MSYPNFVQDTKQGKYCQELIWDYSTISGRGSSICPWGQARNLCAQRRAEVLTGESPVMVKS